jgi:hypothetical protein
MDVIKAECDRDVATNASSLDGKNMKQNVKEEPKDVSFASSNQQREVRKLTSIISAVCLYVYLEVNVLKDCI